MGRKKLMKTKVQRDEQRRKWVEASNKRRRERYQTDPEYREKVREQSRESSLKSRGKSESAEEKGVKCRLAIYNIEAYLTEREVYYPNSGAVVENVATSAEMARALGLSHVVVLHKWHRSGRFPRPMLEARVGRTHANVYTETQLRKLLEIMNEHYSKHGSLQETDKETIEALHGAMQS